VRRVRLEGGTPGLIVRSCAWRSLRAALREGGRGVAGDLVRLDEEVIEDGVVDRTGSPRLVAVGAFLFVALLAAEP